MRITVFLLLAGCAMGRTGLIREAAARVVPQCAVDDPGKVRWKEISGWTYVVNACGEELWCRERTGMKCLKRSLIAELLRCPASGLTFTPIDFEMGDPVRDRFWWGANEVTGCGRAAWCGEHERKSDGEISLVCEPPDDFNTAAAQLAVESGCPAAQIQPEARQVFTERVAKRPPPGQQKWTIDMQISWRLSGCGRTYSCAVNGGAAPAVACKAALDAAPALTPPPAPPSGP
jgi:hypothetical protein